MSQDDITSRISRANEYLELDNHQAALPVLTSLAESDNVYGKLGLSLLVYNGWETPKDLNRAMELVSSAAKTNDVVALLYLARMQDVTGSISEASLNYRRAANLGSRIGTYQIALRYLHGIDVSADKNVATGHLNSAYERGHIWAHRILSKLYIAGDFGPWHVPLGHGIVFLELARLTAYIIRYGSGYPLTEQALSLTESKNIVQYGKSILSGSQYPW